MLLRDVKERSHDVVADRRLECRIIYPVNLAGPHIAAALYQRPQASFSLSRDRALRSSARRASDAAYSTAPECGETGPFGHKVRSIASRACSTAYAETWLRASIGLGSAVLNRPQW